MANRKRGEVEIVLDGCERVLVFDWNAISDLEQQFGGKSVEEIFLSGSGISRLALREAVRVGLIRKYKPLPSKKVGQMLSKTIQCPEDLQNLIKAVLSGVLAASGHSDDAIESLEKELSPDEDSDEEEPAVLLDERSDVLKDADPQRREQETGES